MIFLEHTQRRNIFGRTPLDELSARRKKNLPDNSQPSQKTDIHSPAGFEPTISAGERPQPYSLDRAATGTGLNTHTCVKTGFLGMWNLVVFFDGRTTLKHPLKPRSDLHN
jgi:hypothetical protein